LKALFPFNFFLNNQQFPALSFSQQQTISNSSRQGQSHNLFILERGYLSE